MEGESLQAALGFLDSWLGYRALQVDIPGFSVAIYYGDGIVFRKAYGLAHVARNEPLKPEHLFGVASLSKMFTGTALMQLAHAGKLQLDDPASKYLPWLAKHHDKRFSEITIRQLLSHSAGLVRDGPDSDYWEFKEHFPSAADLRKAVLASGIVLEPNTSLKYSNLGFGVLGQVVGAVSGKPHTAFITEHIIQSLNLNNTYADYSSQLDARLPAAYGAAFEHRRRQFARRLPTRALAAAVGVHADTEAMCLFAAANFLGNSQLLPDRLKIEMQRTQFRLDHGYDNGTEFGLGFEIQHIGERRVVGHSGHIAGYCTAVFFDPNERLAVTVMANCKDAPAVQMVRGIFEALDYFAVNATARTPKELARFNARLRNRTATVEIVATKQRLAAIDPDDWEPFTWLEELERVNDTTLRVTTPGSIFNEGELIRYTFADDVVETVRYAGFTMLPESRFQQLTGSKNESLTGNDQLFQLDDLQRAELTFGRVVTAQTCSRGAPAPFRLIVDFGPEFGVTHTFLSQLPPHSTTQSLRGCAVLGAVYSVWHFGSPKREVIVVVIASPGSDSPLPDTLLHTMANPSRPQSLPPSLAWRQFDQYYARASRSYFKFEPLPNYAVEDEDWGEAQSLPAWLQGKYRKSLALLNKTRDDTMYWPSWLVAQNRSTKQHVRVRVTDAEPTAYQRWEVEIYRRILIPVAGETIYLLPRKFLAGVNAPHGDFVIFDDFGVAINGNSQADRLTHATFYDRGKGHDISQFIDLKGKILKLALTHGEKVFL